MQQVRFAENEIEEKKARRESDDPGQEATKGRCGRTREQESKSSRSRRKTFPRSANGASERRLEEFLREETGSEGDDVVLHKVYV